MPHFARFEKRKKNETMENLTENTIDKLEQAVMRKQELKTNIDKMHRARLYQPRNQPQFILNWPHY